jgi:hypothetical protein
VTSEAVPVGPPTSLTEWLRRRSDTQLAQLLQRRPDLALPAPADLATFASRIGVRTSVQRAVDTLDAWTLRVLDAMLLATGDAPYVGRDRVESLLPGLPVGPALDELRVLALVWGDDDALHLLGAVREAVGSYPAGLGRPAAILLRSVSDLTLAPVLRRLGLPPAGQPRAGHAVADVLANPVKLAGLIEESTPAERDVLDRLATGPPIGLVRDALLSASTEPQTPPHRLIRRGLLVPIDGQTVELPREVGLALRGPQPLGAISPGPPAIEFIERPVDAIGATAVLETLRRVESLADEWTRHPPPSLRAGGVGVRELRRTTRVLDIAETVLAVLIEVAAAASLLGPTPGPEPVYLPTADFDDWRRRDPARRWVALATAWLGMTRQPGLVGVRDDRGRLITVLGPDAERGTAPALRSQVLAVLADLPPGAAPAEAAAALARLSWQAPRRAASQLRAAQAILDEAETLGVTASGGLTSYGRALLGSSLLAPTAEDALAAALPEPVDHFLVQPDLTVVVPGPPVTALAEDLAAIANLESTGGASVYRVTETSVRRGLDAGRSAAELTALFVEHSRTPVPQALRYLIDDVARRHGILRAGVAAGYLRCDDEALLARVVADRSAGVLGLRRIAPTVAVSTAPVARVLDVLRDAGHAPSAESADGAVLTLEADRPRAPSRPTPRLARARSAGESPAHLAELIRRMRAGDQLTQLVRWVRPPVQPVPGVTTAATLGLLRSAIRGEETVWLGYVDSHGTASQHTIEPISMAGGVLRGHDVATGRLESFALHHVTAVRVLKEGTAP